MQSNKTYYAHESAIIDEGAIIGNNTKIWHFCHIMGGAAIGDDCSIGQNCFIASGVSLGNNVKIQNNVSVYEGVSCADNVFIGPSVVFTNVINPRSAVVRKNEYRKTIIDSGVSIGANATIVCGNSLGKYAFIGAGAVLTKSVPDYALMVGNPAKQIGWVSEYGHRLDFDTENTAICKESGQEYRLINNEKVIRVDKG